MRTISITKLILTAAILLSAAVSAQAATTFTFYDGIMPENTNDRTEISDYMTRVYGSQVYVTDGEIRENDYGDLPEWIGKGDFDNFLRCGVGSGDLEIEFRDVPIISASADGYVFETTDGPDFIVAGFDDTFGDEEDPLLSSYVHHQAYSTDSVGGGPFTINFSRPVSLLIFSDGGVDDVGIDNLTVQSVPTPSAMLLGSLGMGITGWLKRRRTL